MVNPPHSDCFRVALVLELDREVWVRGVEVNYYFICLTKLWFFARGVQLEKDSDLVGLGRFIHSRSYVGEEKGVLVDNRIAIDFVRRGDVLELHEVKLSDRMELAHEMQLLYYLYYLGEKGVRCRGVISYPKLRRKKKVLLTEENKEKLVSALEDIRRVVSMDKPPRPVRRQFCRRCAYLELCFGG